MSYRNILLIIFLYAFNINPLDIQAQDNSEDNAGKGGRQLVSRLFETDDILHFKLTGKLNELYKDISSNNSNHPVLLQYLQKDSSLVSIALRVKTRGHFRRMKGNCAMPPLLLTFPKGDKIKNTVFENQSKLKLVVPCQGDDYVIEEYLVYKLYNLISKNSFRARLALVDFEDSLHRKKTETHYCFLLEDQKQMAERNNCFVWKHQMLNMRNTNPEEFRKMAVFQYMIGNTDWGVLYLQNIVLITEDSLMAPITVPYDFDHAGIVDPYYAGPAPELELSSILERLYRGYCETDLKNFAPTFELFNKLRPDFYNVYTSCPLLATKYIKFVKRYLDDFYNTINSKRLTDAEFGKPCRTDTHVEIKGLKN